MKSNALPLPSAIYLVNINNTVGALGALFRFNMVILICFVFGLVVWARPPLAARLKYAAVVIGVAAFVGWHMSFDLWKEMGVRLIPLEIKKLGYFWLSTDQAFSTQASRPLSRLGRACGVLIYWGFLLLALRGWWFLRQKDKSIADLILFGLIVVTIAHLPFAMNTRIRIPLFDPLLAILAAGCLTHYLYRTVCLDAAEVGVAPQLLS